MDLKVSWSRIKEFIDAGYPYGKESYNSDYFVYTYDGAITRHCVISGADKTEYDTDYISGEFNPTHYDSDSKSLIVAPTLEDSMGLYPKKKTYKQSVTGGQTNFFDNEVLTERRICGGEYWVNPDDISNVHNNDYVEFSIIDKNDVLGLFSTYGLTVGVDILEICKFVVTDYVKKGSSMCSYHSELWQGIIGTNKVIPGLFFRVCYESSGTGNIGFIWRLYYYE